MHRTQWIVLGLALLGGACTSPRVSLARDGGTYLSQTEGPNGSLVSWRLFADGDRTPMLDRIEVTTDTVAELGLEVTSLTTEFASALGVPAYRGVYISNVVAGGPAALSGVLAGELVLELNGVSITSQAQFEDLVEFDLCGTSEVTLLLGNSEADTTREARFMPVADPVTDTQRDSFELAAPEWIERATGLQVVTIVPEISEEIYRETRITLVIAGVVVGSPAYHAGVRSSDRILSCDGQPITEEGLELPLAILARLDPESLDPEIRARFKDAEPWPAGKDDPLVLEVNGNMGRHEAVFNVVNDYQSDSKAISVLGLMDYDSTSASRRLSLLDGFSFGAEYEKSYAQSATREPAQTTRFYLPFGLFRYERNAERALYRLLWFINL